jgi:hypothetical protein
MQACIESPILAPADIPLYYQTTPLLYSAVSSMDIKRAVDAPTFLDLAIC